MKLAHRMGEIGTETAFEVLAKARKLEAQGRNIVHLEIGEPDFPTPPNIVEAAERALHDGYTHYTPAGGLMPARQAVAFPAVFPVWAPASGRLGAPGAPPLAAPGPLEPPGGVLLTNCA